MPAVSSELPSNESLRCFVAAARLLNFRAAARSVGLTPAALGQRVKQLEELVGRELFARTTRRVALTQAGLQLLPQAHATLAAAEQCVRAAHGDATPVPQELVLGTRHELGMSWLLPMLPRLSRAHPGTTFHLYFGSGADLLLRVRSGEVHCAVGSMRALDPKLDSVRLHREDYALVASKKLLAKTPFRRALDAVNHTLLDASAELPLFSYWRDAEGQHVPPPFQRISYFGTIAAIHELVRAGAGVAVLPTYLTRHDLARGRLVKVLPSIVPAHDYFRLLFRADDPRRAAHVALAQTMLQVPLT